METTDKGAIGNVPESLKKNLDWYIANQRELSKSYNGKILLIVDQQVMKAFDSMGAAYHFAMGACKPNTFTLQPCSPDPDSYTLTLYNPAFSIAE